MKKDDILPNKVFKKIVKTMHAIFDIFDISFKENKALKK